MMIRKVLERSCRASWDRQKAAGQRIIISYQLFLLVLCSGAFMTGLSSIFDGSASKVPAIQESARGAPSDFQRRMQSASLEPTVAPTVSQMPSEVPTISMAPTISQAPSVSAAPSLAPSISAAPSVSAAPSFAPSISSAPSISAAPSVSAAPSLAPSISAAPSVFAAPSVSALPSIEPSVSEMPSKVISFSAFPSGSPTGFLTVLPFTSFPSESPSGDASNFPSSQPSAPPSSTPTYLMTENPSSVPSEHPSTAIPTKLPTDTPSLHPSASPSTQPSPLPSAVPSNVPSKLQQAESKPSNVPTFVPTFFPTPTPTQDATQMPSIAPSPSPTFPATPAPSKLPSDLPPSDSRQSPTVPGSEQNFSVIPTLAPIPCPSERAILEENYYIFFEEFNTSIVTNETLESAFNQSFSEHSSDVLCDPEIINVTRIMGAGERRKLQFEEALVFTVRLEFRVFSLQANFSGNFTGLFPTPLIRGLFLGSFNDFMIHNDLPAIFAVGIKEVPPPTEPPSMAPSVPGATVPPTGVSSSSPSNIIPTHIPTSSQSAFPSLQPTDIPLSMPSTLPTHAPTMTPSTGPTGWPTFNPTAAPTLRPSLQPTHTPSSTPSTLPTHAPTANPSTGPTGRPTFNPTARPILQPSPQPTDTPSSTPSTLPTHASMATPSTGPTGRPTFNPTARPTLQPSRAPDFEPTTAYPTRLPTPDPTISPSYSPTGSPTVQPSPTPSAGPTRGPSREPTDHPSSMLSKAPTRMPAVNKTVTPSPASQPRDETSDVGSASPSLAPVPLAWESPIPAVSPSMTPAAVLASTQSYRHSQMPSISMSKQPSVSPTAQNFSSANYALREPQLKSARMVLTGVSRLGLHALRVWTNATESFIEEDVVSILGNVETVDAQVEVISQDPQSSPRSLRTESSLPMQPSNLTVLFNVNFFIRSVVENHDVRRYVGAALDSEQEQTAFIARLKSGDADTFSNLTAVHIFLDHKAASEVKPPVGTANSGSMSTGLTVGLAAISVAGASLFAIAIVWWSRRRNSNSRTSSSSERNDNNNGNLFYYEGGSDIMFDGNSRAELDVSTLGDPIPQGISPAPMDMSVADETQSLPYDYKVATARPLLSLDESASYSAFSDVSSNIIDVQTDDDTLNAQYNIEDRIEVEAPPGVLGLVLEADTEGVAAVYDMKELSPLADRVRIGDKLVAVDEVDVTVLSVESVMKLVASRRTKDIRRLVFSRPRKAQSMHLKT